ncbi:lactonase family protein [Isoptericola chiayiensis]|uniref:lactonase family protein n=1 Tax=Isoptericola chiayiensis TaxID=579446 RepID=UPI001556C2D6|nr:beta-propeller fold lactonase family protein [Isoptericola chiayiensis]NOV99603.1 6-phosphogluconolactonase (cycloisomerase 2 family) [Isoptericola chiayiensis]
MTEQPVPLWIGTYPAAGSAPGTGEGVWRVTVDPVSGTFGAPALAAELTSPSFLARHPHAPVLYAVAETPGGALTALRVHDGGTIEPSSTLSSGGDDPCHVAASVRAVWVTNYGDGVASVVAVSDDGTPEAEHRALYAGGGSGPVTDRQEGPHAHQVTVVDDHVLVTDLGADVVRRYPLDPPASDAATSDGEVAARLPAGTGPRHLVVLPGGALVVAGELDARLHVLVPGGDGWEHAGSAPVSPGAAVGEAFPGHVTLSEDGRRVHVGVRGPDVLAVHEVSDDGPHLKHVGDVPLGEGAWPRHHEVVAGSPDGELVVVALQGSAELVTVHLDDDGTGTVLDRAAWATPPACVLVAS